MANLTVYANQPATKGKVVLHTTIGPFDVELWSKEAPLACRNFVQLCMEGYYDGCIFHRVIKDFMAQTGDPTGTGTGGASVYEEGGPEGAGPEGVFKVSPRIACLSHPPSRLSPLATPHRSPLTSHLSPSRTSSTAGCASSTAACWAWPPTVRESYVA